ncbi:LysR family substrate-binding domain-containing protein [Pedosphaera parvula]|uniref:LysR substrate-binding n=1 Tax=Pedosphaera parvula (strain Ellin514) TaxID=320771 RepID=B9XA57_PEDPL|nr:LysR family substrate-binding domain-containing protein [Pedosphaera parvula]EEF63398.1 LysR substrate-binding [Pedosphaera parvula Ellin514]
MASFYQSDSFDLALITIGADRIPTGEIASPIFVRRTWKKLFLLSIFHALKQRKGNGRGRRKARRNPHRLCAIIDGRTSAARIEILPGVQPRCACAASRLVDAGDVARSHQWKVNAALLVQVPPQALAGLVFQELQHHPVCVAIHRAHPLARARRVGLERVARERLVAFTLAEYPEHQGWIAELFAPLNRHPQIVDEHDSFTSLIAAVESGKGLALIAQPLKGLASPRLRIRPLQPAPPPLGVGIVYNKKFRSTLTDNFIAAARRNS